MLNDPLQVAVQQASLSTFDGASASLDVSTIVSFRSLGGAIVGSSVRECSSMLGCKALLSINHSQSKENSPLITDRSVVRLDLKKNDSLGKPVGMSAYVVTALPQGGVFTDADCLAAVKTLLALLLFGDVLEGGSVFGSDAAHNTLLPRVIEGEP